MDDAFDDVDSTLETTPTMKLSPLPPQPSGIPTAPMPTPMPPNPVDDSAVSSGATTPKAQPSVLPSLPPSAPGSPAQTPDQVEGEEQSYFSLAPPTPPEKASSDVNLLHRLQNLRHSFQRTEQTLYAALARTPASALNDVRIAFLNGARGATRRLTAWQQKHMPKAAKSQPVFTLEEPEWWKKSCHALPGGNIIVREDDWGSIIAFTLGCVYKSSITKTLLISFQVY